MDGNFQMSSRSKSDKRCQAADEARDMPTVAARNESEKPASRVVWGVPHDPDMEDVDA
jgi:hypothetical protein